MAVKDEELEVGSVQEKTPDTPGQDTGSAGYTVPKYTPSTPYTNSATNLYNTAKDAYNSGNIRGAASTEVMGNMVNGMTGNQVADNYKYSGALNPTDYSARGKAQMSAGVGAGIVAATLDDRSNKIANTVGYEQYANDATQQAMADYAQNGGFKYSDPYGYQDMMAGLNPQIMGKIKDYSNSTYSDYKSGPEYQNLADRYRQQGQLAMEDTLGTASQMSGGLDNSYALAAAQQAYNGYMSNLELAAQNAYQNQLQNQASQINALQGQQGNLLTMDNTLYNREYTNSRDFTNDYMWGREFNEKARQYDDTAARDDRQYAGNQTYNYWYANNGLQRDYDSMAMDYDLGLRGFDNNLQTAAISANTTLAGQANQYAIAGLNNATDLQIAQMNNDTKLSTAGSSGGSTKENTAAAKQIWQSYLDTGDEKYRKQYNQMMGISDPTSLADQKKGSRS